MSRAGAWFLLCLALGACAQPVLRQSACLVQQPGVTLCHYAYEGDEASK